MNSPLMWIIVLIIILTSLVSGFIWMSFAITRFSFIAERISHNKWKRVLIGASINAMFMIILYYVFDFINMIMIFLHLLIIWLICEGLLLLIERFRKKTFDNYYAGICSIIITTLWLCIGWYNAHAVKRTAYEVETNKTIGSNLKIVGLSDSHIGATFHWQEFDEYIKRINSDKPDIVVIMGDFIDDDTSKEDMINSCKSLSKLKTRYGVYFIYGNHDEGYWNNSIRGYNIEDLDKNLKLNNVKILRDETIQICNNVHLCGRLDKSRSKDRKKANEFMKFRNDNDYVICLDHEPNDYQAESKSMMDLVISGHTHGGQFLGLGPLGVFMGANDAYYGLERRDKTDFIVSSGIGDWAIKFKTGCISEYIVINIKQETY